MLSKESNHYDHRLPIIVVPIPPRTNIDATSRRKLAASPRHQEADYRRENRHRELNHDRDVLRFASLAEREGWKGKSEHRGNDTYHHIGRDELGLGKNMSRSVRFL